MSASSLRVTVDGAAHTLAPNGESWIGRDPGCRIVVANPLVSGRHLRLWFDGTSWQAQDVRSTNGTWSDGRRVSGLRIDRETRLRLAADGPEVVLTPLVAAAAAAPSARVAGSTTPPPVPAPTAPPTQASPQAPPQGPPVAATQRQAPVSPTPPPPPPSGGARVGTAAGPPAGPPPGSAPNNGPVFTGVHRVAQSVVHIGRDPSNEIVLQDLLVSRRHAELHVGIGHEIVDLGSANGTFVNGQRVIGRAPLREGDIVSIGRHQLRLSGDQLLAYEDTGDLTFVASELTVQVGGGKVLLHRVGFSLPPRTLLGVVGPSGSGKSTLLGALTGIRPATSGMVSYAGRDLYAEYDDLRQRIGLVPQDDIWHTALTVREALQYGAELRFPSDVTSGERERRIDEVLFELSLQGRQANRGGELSGGQRKRVSTALELLTKPSLLFLDEPTSGLDPDLDGEVMHLLRDLANDGRTVVVVTHSTLNLDVCDLLLVLAEGGHLAYLGPPTEALRYFGARTYPEMFHRLKSRPPAEWGERFRATPEFTHYVMGGAGGPAAGRRRTDLPPMRRQSLGSQFSTLCRRYLSVIGADKAYLGLLLGLPIVLAGISRVIPSPHGLALDPGGPNLKARQLLTTIILGAVLMGAATAVREIVKERAVYQRERSIGLSRGAYLASKVAVLGVIVVLQAILLTVLALIGRPGLSDPLIVSNSIIEIAIPVIVLTFASAMLGLLISAWVNNADRAMPLMVLMVMIQLVFCGGLVAVAGRPVLNQVSFIVPARWGFAAVAASADLQTIENQPPAQFHAACGVYDQEGGPNQQLTPEQQQQLQQQFGLSAADAQSICHPQPSQRDALWKHSSGVWVADIFVLLLLAAASVGATALLLRRMEPKRRVALQVQAPVGPVPVR